MKQIAKIIFILAIIAVIVFATIKAYNSKDNTISRLAMLDGNTYYVSQTGSGTVCSSINPCSVSTGMNKLLPGDILKISGTLKTGLIFSKNGTASKHVGLQGGAINAPHSTQNALLITGSYVEVSNIDISGGDEFGIRTKGHDLIISDFVVHDTVWGNRSGDSCIGGSGGWGRGVTTGPTSYNVEIFNGKIYNNCGEGLAVTQSHDIYFHDLEVFDNFSRNVYIGNGPFVTVERLFTHCENINFFRNGAPARGIGLAIETTNYSTYGNQLHDVIINNNRIENCLGINYYSEVSGQYPKDITISNNNFVNVPKPQISVPGTNIIISGNIIGTLTPTMDLSPTSTMPVFSPTMTYTPSATATPTNTSTSTPTLTPTSTATFTATSMPTPVLCVGGIAEFVQKERLYYYCLYPVP